MAPDPTDDERLVMQGTAALLSEIAASFDDPEITPEVRYLALLALYDPLPLERSDIRILAAAVVRKLRAEN